MEEGDKVTEWSPAPEDTQGQLNSLDSRMDSAEVAITPTAIVSTVRSSAGYTSDLGAKTDKTAIISTINQTAESVKISASKIDITGSVTFSSLDSATQTKVTNGDTANTTLNANKSTWDTASTNATTALNGTTQYRTTGVPTNNPTPSGIATTTNTNGTVSYKLSWNTYTQGAKKADFLMIFWRKDGVAPTVTDSSVSVAVNTSNPCCYMFEGVNPADTFSFGIASARKTENGLEIGAIQCPTATPDWLGVTSGTPNFTANIGGTSASTVVTNASNGNTANSTVTTCKPNWDDAKAKVDLWKHASDVTKIDGGNIYTNSITATQIDATNLHVSAANIDGTITSGRATTVSGGYTLSDLYYNANGGLLSIYDNTGLLNVKLGSENGTSSNIGGTLILYNDADTKPRVELGIEKTKDAGVINVKDTSGTVRASVCARNTGTDKPAFFITNTSGTVVSSLTETSGTINSQNIATYNWVASYNIIQNYITYTGASNAITAETNNRSTGGDDAPPVIYTEWISLTVNALSAGGIQSFDNITIPNAGARWITNVNFVSASSLAHELKVSVINWGSTSGSYVDKISLRARNISDASYVGGTVKVCVLLVGYC